MNKIIDYLNKKIFTAVLFKRYLSIFFMVFFIFFIIPVYVFKPMIRTLELGPFTVPIKVEIKFNPGISYSPELYKISPRNNYDKVNNDSNLNSNFWIITGEHVKKIAFKFNNAGKISDISQLKIIISDKEYSYTNKNFLQYWDKKIDNKDAGVFYLSPNDVRYKKSFLSLISGLFNTMNWPGDMKAFSFIFIKNIINIVKGFLLIIVFILFFIYRRYLFLTSNKFLNKINFKYKYILLLLALIAVSVCIRFYSFSRVIHVDEPSYIVIADRILKGDILYTDVWDTKSPGLFLYYVFVMSVFKSLTGIRIIGSVIIAITAFMIYHVLKIFIDKEKNIYNKNISWIGAFTYVIISSYHKFNLWINPEQLISLFGITALFFLLKDKKYSVFLCSVFLGLSFFTKYPAVLDYLAFAVIWLYISFKYKKEILYIFKNIVFSIIGFILPIGIFLLYYLINGHLMDFFNTIYYVAFVYPNPKSLSGVWELFYLFVTSLFPIFVLFILGLFYLIMSKRHRFLLFICTAWGISTAIVIFSTGHPFVYYWFQIYPVLALVIPFGVKLIEFIASKLNKKPVYFAPLYVILCFIAADLLYNNIKDKWKGKEPLIEVYDYFKGKINKNDKIFAHGTGSQILYYWLDIKPPSKNVHPHNYGIKEEIVFIKPRYIVFSEGSWKFERNTDFAKLVSKNYILNTKIAGVLIYEFKNKQVK